MAGFTAASSGSWASMKVNSQEDMVNYLQADSNHNKRTQERAQKLFNAAPYVVQDTFTRDVVTQDLNFLPNHTHYKLRLDLLRYSLQLVSKSVLVRLKRTNDLVQWLCDVATYSPKADGDGDSDSDDIKSLTTRAHPLRGKALSVLVFLIRVFNSTSTNGDVEDKLCASAAAAQVVLLGAPLLMPQIDNDDTKTNAMLGSVLVHQAIEIWEVTMNENDDDSDDENEIFKPINEIKLISAKAIAPCTDPLAKLMYALGCCSVSLPCINDGTAPKLDIPSGISSPQIFSRVLIDVSKALAAATSASALLSKSTSKSKSDMPNIDIDIYIDVDLLYKASYAIIQIATDGPMIHDAFIAAIHSLIRAIESTTENVLQILYKMEVIITNSIDSLLNSVNDKENDEIMDPALVQRIDGLIGMLSSIWESWSIKNVIVDSSLEIETDSIDHRFNHIIELFTKLQVGLKNGLKKFGRNSEGKPDNSSGVTSQERNDMRVLCTGCRNGCVSVLQELFSSSLNSTASSQVWIRDNISEYYYFALKTMAAPTLLIAAYTAFNSTTATDPTTITMHIKEKNKILQQLYNATISIPKYSLKAATDIIEAINMLAFTGCIELLTCFDGLEVTSFNEDDGKEESDRNSDSDSDSDIDAPIAVALLRAYIFSPIIPKNTDTIKTNGDDEEDDEPPICIWRRSVLIAFENILSKVGSINAPKFSFEQWKDLHGPLGSMIQVLSLEITDIMQLWGNSNNSSEMKKCKKRLMSRFGTTDLEILGAVASHASTVYMAILKLFCGRYNYNVDTDTVNDWSLRWGTSLDPLSALKPLSSFIQGETEMSMSKVEVPIFWSEKGKLTMNTKSNKNKNNLILSLNYIKYVIVTISNSTGRPYVYEGELMQHCLELDVLRTCVIALSQLLGAIQMQDVGAGIDVNLNVDDLNNECNEIWKDLCTISINGALNASGLEKIYQLQLQLSSPTQTATTTTQASSTIKAKLKKSCTLMSSIYGYAREVIFEINDCHKWRAKHGLHSSSNSAIDYESISSQLSDLLPDQLSSYIEKTGGKMSLSSSPVVSIQSILDLN
jgi:hypothetical protein